VHEIKHDGYRLIVRKEGAAVCLFTRNGHDWSGRFPAIAQTAGRLKVHSFTIELNVCSSAFRFSRRR
jgi:ATP-dependent DNA ligase